VGDAEVVDEAHRGQRRARTEDLRGRLEQRAELCVAVGRALHGCPVDPERDVVEEQATVHLADVDRAFEPIGERVERADEIVGRGAEIAGEVVARTGRDADEGQPVRNRGRRHDRQRSVSARHPERVAVVGHRALGERPEVVPGSQDHGLDATFTRRLVEARVAGLAAAGQRIDEEHRPLRGLSAQPAGLRHRRQRHDHREHRTIVLLGQHRRRACSAPAAGVTRRRRCDERPVRDGGVAKSGGRGSQATDRCRALIKHRGVGPLTTVTIQLRAPGHLSGNQAGRPRLGDETGLP
jgi:hypothetical protein